MEWNGHSQLAGETWWETQCSVYEELCAAPGWRRRWPSRSRVILRCRRQAPRQRCLAVGSPGVVPGVGAAMRGLHAAGRLAFVRRRRGPTLLQSSVQCLAQQKQLVAVIRLPDDCQHVPFIYFLNKFWYCSDHFCDDSQKEVISLLLLLLLLQPQFSFQF